MSKLTPGGAEALLRRYEGLSSRLPGARLPWLASLRAAAAAAFRAQGLPSRRAEAWRYTDLRPIAEVEFAEPLLSVTAALPLPAQRLPRRAVFVDGRFREGLSELGDDAVALGSLAADLPAAEGRLGRLARPEEHPLAALNTALFEDGLTVTVPAGIDAGGLELSHFVLAAERPLACHPRHLIRLEAGARLLLLESAQGDVATRYLHNPVFEIEIAEGASLVHVRLSQEGEAGFQLGTIYARIEAGGTYDNFTLNAGGRLVRNEIHAVLAGPEAACHMNGAQLLRDGQHADTTTVLDHAAPDCRSRQTYKTVLSGRSRGVFQGRIHVHQVAQRTDGYQMNQALLLSPEAEIDSKPQLEIYADDVKCSHGATVGALDADQLFYLRARGIPEPAARTMLIDAFLQDVVDTIAEGPARDAVATAIADWWRGQA
jgi:Fe-S cluster assembly protein SufD